MIKAKRSSKVLDLGVMLKGMHLEEEVELAGIKWTLRTLEPHEAIEADGLVSDLSSMQAGRSYGRAVLAYSITKIDGQPVESHFEFPPKPSNDPELEAEWEAIKADADRLRRWHRMQVYDYLVHDMQDEMLSRLFVEYAKLADRKKKAVEALPGFSKGTPSTAPSPT